MASTSAGTPDDPRALLARVRALTRGVRHDQGAGWFALLVFGVVTLLATPFYRYGPTFRHCTAHVGPAYACTVYPTFALWYWPFGLLLGYLAITWFCLRRSQHRGIGTHAQPYLAVGILLGLGAMTWLVWALVHPDFLVESLHLGSSASSSLAFRIASPAGAIGLALLVLAWIERAWLLAAITIAYLIAVDSGTHATHAQPSRWVFLPHLLLVSGILLAGAAILALVHHSTRQRPE